MKARLIISLGACLLLWSPRLLLGFGTGGNKNGPFAAKPNFTFVFKDSAHVQLRPPLSPIRIAGEAVTGQIAGVTGFVAFGFAIDRISRATGGRGITFDGDSGFDSKQLEIMLAGYSLGLAAGVSLIGKMGDQTGSFPLTCVGSAAGTVLMLLAVTKSTLVKSPVITSPVIVLPTLGSIVAFNLSRHFDGVSITSGFDNQSRSPMISMDFKFDAFAGANYTKRICE